jgi:hypothetical protein
VDRGDRPGQSPAPARVVVGGQLGRFAGGPLGDVGERQPELGKTDVVDEGQRPGDEAGGVEQPVERIAGAGEVMADPGRDQARVDADEEDARSRAQAGGQAHRVTVLRGSAEDER